MPFRYEIWGYTDSGLLNDQLHISSYSKLYDVTPNDNGFSLTVEKYEDQEFYRVKPSGALKFTGDDWSVIQDITEDCTPYLLVLFDTSLDDRSVFIRNNFWDTADYIGFVKKRSTIFDYDRCEATVEPETFDIYTQFLKTYNNEYNLFEYTTREWVKAEDGTSGFEYKNDQVTITRFINEISYDDEEITDFSDWDIIEDDTHPYWQNFKKGLLYQCRQEKITVQGEFGILGFIWEFYFTYKREYVDIESDVIPPDATSDWELINQQPDGLYRWVRTPLNITSPTYTKVLEQVNEDESKTIINILGNSIDFEPRQRGITLSSALEGLRRASEFSTATPSSEVFKVSSTFLNSSTNPITSTTNRYKNLVLMQASDAKPTTDPATVLNISLKDILDSLRMLNLRWFLQYDGSGLNSSPLIWSGLNAINTFYYAPQGTYMINFDSYSGQDIFWDNNETGKKYWVKFVINGIEYNHSYKHIGVGIGAITLDNGYFSTNTNPVDLTNTVQFKTITADGIDITALLNSFDYTRGDRVYIYDSSLVSTSIKPILKIEHIKYFENGYSYGSLSSQHEVESSRLVIGFTSDKTPQKEKMNTSFAFSRDFIGKPIEYPVGCAGDEEVQYQFNISADVLQYILKPEETPNDIVLLLATEKDSLTVVLDGVPYTLNSYTILANTGALSGFNILNTDLSVANLQEDLWTYDRYAPTGTVNGSEVTFDSVKRMRQQQKVSVTIPYKKIIPYKGVTTGYGLGKISDATYNIRNCKWDTTLIYE